MGPLLMTRCALEKCSLQMLHYPESGIWDSIQVAQKHEAVSQKRNAIWCCWTVNFNSFKWESLTYFCIKFPVCKYFCIHVISCFFKYISSCSLEAIFTKLLQNYFLCIIILDTFYFVISWTPGVVVSPTPKYGSF